MPNTIDLKQVNDFVDEHISDFLNARLRSLEGLTIEKALARKNPYLFLTKNALIGADLGITILDDFLTLQEESLFGEFLENLAIFVCSQVFDGRKSAAEGIDLEFTKDGIIYIVSVKSGPNWGNSRQIAGMKADFLKAKRILRTNRDNVQIQAVNGCCYGRAEKYDKGDYWKLCGQRFWEFISNRENLYVEIIEPLGHQAKERNEEFQKSYAQASNRFAREIFADFITDDLVDYVKLIEFVSGVKKPMFLGKEESAEGS